jgi:hypothetical protein
MFCKYLGLGMGCCDLDHALNHWSVCGGLFIEFWALFGANSRAQREFAFFFVGQSV